VPYPGAREGCHDPIEPVILAEERQKRIEERQKHNPQRCVVEQQEDQATHPLAQTLLKAASLQPEEAVVVPRGELC